MEAADIHVCIYTYVHVYAYVYVYRFTHIHPYIQTYAYTQSFLSDVGGRYDHGTAPVIGM